MVILEWYHGTQLNDTQNYDQYKTLRITVLIVKLNLKYTKHNIILSEYFYCYAVSHSAGHCRIFCCYAESVVVLSVAFL
jgi:hypothetical protein